RFEREEGHRAERGVGDPVERPAPEAAWREAQRVVLECLVRDPSVVVAPDLDDTLGGSGIHGPPSTTGCPGVDVASPMADEGRAHARSIPAPSPARPAPARHMSAER